MQENPERIAHAQERITALERHTIEHPCGICGGHDGLAHEKDGRCFGFTSGAYIHCTQSAYRGQLERIETSGTFGHWTGGACKCGLPHDRTLRTPRQGNGHPVERKRLRTIEFKLCNPAGEWIATHIRREYENAPKDFSWILPDQNAEGLFGKRKESLPLYRSELLASMPADALVIVTEGEKKCDALIEHDYLAVATVTGASGEIPCDESLAILKGRSVYLWPDNDEVGKKHMDRLAERLKKLGVIARVISWQDAGEKEDAADFFRKGGTKEQVGHLLDHAEEWQEPVPPELAIQPGFPAPEILSKELPPIEYMIQPIASAENLTILQGEPKGGKSCFALYCAISAAIGAWCSSRFLVPKPRRVLFVTYEDGLRRIKTRLNEYCSGLKCEAPHDLIIYTRQNAPVIRLETALGRALLQKLIDTNHAEMAVLDTFSHVTAGEENSKKEMQPVVDALKDIAREMKCSITALHHTGKPGTNDNKKSMVYRGRGSSAISAAADIILDFGNRGKTNVTPCELVSKDDDPDSFNVIYTPQDDGGVKWILEDGEADDRKQENRAKVAKTLEEFMLTSPDGIPQRMIVDGSGLSLNTVKRCLEDLMHRGFVVWVARGAGPAKLWKSVKKYS